MEPAPLAPGAKKERPSVLITTYASERQNSPAAQQQESGRHQEHQGQQQQQHIRLESSTDLFNGKSRSHHSVSELPPKGASLEFHQIRGPSGSVRGHKDVVRRSLQNIRVVASSRRRNFNSAILPTFMGANWAGQTAGDLLSGKRSSANSNSSGSHFIIQRLDEQNRLDYLRSLIEEEQNQCVAYITTLGVIRRTFEDSRLMKTILNLNLINYEERDIYLNQEYKHQLRIRCESITVPALFVDGQFLGGIKELESINESGKLGKLLSKFKIIRSGQPRGVCACCGGAKFIACQSCNGSRKSTIRHFKFSSIALRCIKCDKNDGLVQCPTCCLLPPPPPTTTTTTTSYDSNNNESSELSRYLEDIREKETTSVASGEFGDEQEEGDLKQQLERL